MYTHLSFIPTGDVSLKLVAATGPAKIVPVVSSHEPSWTNYGKRFEDWNICTDDMIVKIMVRHIGNMQLVCVIRFKASLCYVIFHVVKNLLLWDLLIIRKHCVTCCTQC